MKIIIPYKKDDEESLKYTLRGIRTNMGKNDVIISGDMPKTLSGFTYVCPDKPKNIDAQYDCQLNILEAVKTLKNNEDFILFNDDFYVLKPVEKLENWHENSIDEVIKSKKNSRIFVKTIKSLRNTKNLLIKLGIEDPVAYTLHYPVVMNKEKWLECHEICVPYLKNRNIVLPRTVYGNLFSDCSSIHHDFKCYNDIKQVDEVFASSWKQVPEFVKQILDKPSEFEGSNNETTKK